MKKNKFLSSFIDYFNRADKILWVIIIVICSYSLLLLKSVSRTTNGDYFTTQAYAMIIGFIGVIVITLIDYVNISNFWYVIAGCSLFLMIYTLFFGINISSSGGVDATAWISIAGRTFQPSELVKICFIITYAKHLDYLTQKGTINKLKNVCLLALHALIPVILCHEQGDDGAGVVFFFIFIAMSLASTLKWRYFALLGSCVAVAIPIIWNYILSDYQIERFTAILNLDDTSVALNEGYQQYQGRISIGSGGLFGTGLFNGTRVENSYVTFQHSDFIFSVVGEELGFVGCVFLVLTLVALIFRTLYVASKARDSLGKFICFGFFGLIALQSVSNIGMCLALLPVMGVTLPFYSAGGSSVACMLIGFGLVQSVYMRRNDKKSGLKFDKTNTVQLSYKDFKDNEDI